MRFMKLMVVVGVVMLVGYAFTVTGVYFEEMKKKHRRDLIEKEAEIMRSMAKD